MGLKDILASKGKRRILTKMFRPPIFANTIFSQSFNLGGFLALFRFGIMFTPSSCLWACDRHFQVWGGLFVPFLVLGELLAPLFGVGKQLAPFSGITGLLAPFGVWGFGGVQCFALAPFHSKYAFFTIKKLSVSVTLSIKSLSPRTCEPVSVFLIITSQQFKKTLYRNSFWRLKGNRMMHFKYDLPCQRTDVG